MDLAALLLAQSQAVHQRLLDGENYCVKQQEETITESLLLEIAKSSPSDVEITLSTRPEEGRTGVDWAWWWEEARDWFGSVVQAKKLKQNSGQLKYNFGYRAVATPTVPVRSIC